MDGHWKDKLNVIVEATTHCNAKCPQCPRTASRYNQWDNQELRGLETIEWMPLKHWSLEDVKKFFPPETLKNIWNVHFSGSLGDPGMNPEIYDIVSYITDHDTKVSINTNGSMRDETFWFKMGMIATTITFDVDGINQEMHAKYRRNTNLDKVLRNMKAASEGFAEIKSFTVLFKHNEDYWDEIQELCKANGASRCTKSESSRFNKGPVFEFINEDGEVETLEQITKKELKQDRNVINRRVRDHTDGMDLDGYGEIDCIAMNAKSLHINIEGFVWPCCYIANPGDRLSYGAEEQFISKSLLRNPTFMEYINRKQDFNLHNRSLKDILMDPWYTITLPTSFINDPIAACKRTCGKCK